MNGNPTTAAPNNDDEPINIFGGANNTVNFDASAGQLEIKAGDLQFGGGGGGAGGGVIGWTTTASPGGFHIHDPVPELKRQIEELKGKLEVLEKAENERKDIEYFRRNLANALKVPKNYVPIPKTTIGPDDFLIVHIGVKDVPASRVEAFMKRAKKDIQSLFDERGLRGRVLWCPAQEEATARFSVIGVENGPAVEKAMKEAVDYAKATATWTPAKKRYPPPVMG